MVDFQTYKQLYLESLAHKLRSDGGVLERSMPTGTAFHSQQPFFAERNELPEALEL